MAAVCTVPLATSPSGNAMLMVTRIAALEPALIAKRYGFLEKAPQNADVPGPPFAPKFVAAHWPTLTFSSSAGAAFANWTHWLAVASQLAPAGHCVTFAHCLPSHVSSRAQVCESGTQTALAPSTMS